MIKYYSSIKNLYLSFSLFFSKKREYENLRNEKKSLVFIMVFFSLISCFFVKAQSSVNYVLTTGSSSFNSMSGATTLFSGVQDNWGSSVLPIEFNFNYMGISYSHFSVNSNGQLRLHTNAGATSIGAAAVSAYTASTVTIAPMAGDNRTGGGMTYLISGIAPNRKLIVEWSNFYISIPDITNSGNMQLVLNEGTGVIEFIYGNILNPANSSVTRSIFHSSNNTANSSAFITVGTTPSQNTSATSPTANNFAASLPLTNLVNTYIKFTPPNTPLASPINLTFSGLSSASTTLNWVDNSIGESGFLITRATDPTFTSGIVNSVISSTSSNTIGQSYNLVQTGLLPSTTYYYKVQAFSEAIFSTELSGSQSTNAPGTFVSVATGNFGSASTWNINLVPTQFDNIIISSGHTVSIDAVGQVANNVTVNGTLAYGSTPTSFSINGNLLVNSGGVVNVFTGTIGKTLTVAGDITNNGTIDVSVGTTSAGNLILNGTTLQTVSGLGTFNTSVIRNLTFSNTSTSTPNITWLFNNIKIAYNLNITGARVNLGTNKMIFGSGAAGNSLTAPIGSGFLPGGSFSRWWSTTVTGTTITAGSDPTNTTSRYPFLNSTGVQRAMYISRTGSTTGNVAGELTVTYTDSNTLTTGLSVVDGSYTITDRYNGKWTVTKDASYNHAGTHTIAIVANNAFYTTNGNSRLMLANAPLSGTHQNGTISPGAQRIGLTTSDLISGDIYIGLNVQETPFVSVANGNWENPSTWNKNLVPSASDIVYIAAGTTVTVNTASAAANAIMIYNGGVLNINGNVMTVATTLLNNGTVNANGGDLIVNGGSASGITNSSVGTFVVAGATVRQGPIGGGNTIFTNSGVLTVSSGILNINGSLVHSGLQFNQSGGEINIDGNAAGVSANSASSYYLNLTAAVNWTGGNLTIVDPHTSTSATDVFYYSVGVSSNVSTNHTLRFGDGVSTDPGGNAIGFRANTYVGSGRINYGNLIINGGSATNRIVTGGVYTNVILGDLTINSGSEYAPAIVVVVGGNFTNNGIFTQTNTLTLSSYLGTSPIISTVPQVVSGSGLFRNLAISPTANLTSLTVNNSSVMGVTFNVPLSISGTLTMTSGIINTSNTSLLSLGTSTIAGTLLGTPSYTNMIKGPFARTIASGNTNNTYILFPVGKTGYAPIAVAPSTTSVTVMKAEAYDSNIGTQDPSIINMSTTRRWEVPIMSGSVTDLNVRLSDLGILSSSIPVQAPSASGLYSASFGFLATAIAGVSTQSNTPILASNYTGFLSYANSNSCSGVPVPGSTITSGNSICFGSSINLSLQNVISGSGVTYQWKSSTNGTNYSPISGAVNSTLTIIPTEATYYLCEVTCLTSSSSSTSLPVYIVFANNITSTTSGTVCGIGSTTISASASSGNIKWFNSSVGGSILYSGNNFVTPVISSSTNYYAAAESLNGGSVQVGTGVATSGTNLSAFNNYRSSARVQLIYTAEELQNVGLRPGNITSIAFNVSSLGDAATNANYVVNVGSTTLTTFPNTTFLTPTFTTCYGPSTYTHTSTGWQTINFTTPYNWDGVSNLIIEISHDGANLYSSANTFYTVTNGNTVLYSYNNSTSNNTLSTNRFNVLLSGQIACSSPRVAVPVTVTTPPSLTLSGSSATICNGQSTSTAITIITGGSSYDVYTWSPSSGVSGNSSTGWTFNPTSTTTYTLTASQSSGTCSTTATYLVNVNSTPSAITIAPTVPAVCVNSIQSLTVTGGTIGSVVNVGTSNNTNLTTGYPSPFTNYYGGTKHQMLIRASELTALGLSPNIPIQSLSFEVTAVGSTFTGTLQNFQVDMASTNATVLTSTAFLPVTTNVRAASDLPIAVGVVTIPLNGNFAWDGVSNIVIQTSYSNANSGTTNDFVQIKNSDPGFISTNWYRTDSSTATSVLAATTPSSSGNARPNMILDNLASTSITWSPTTNLYTDAAATIPYTGGNATTLYVKSSSVGSTTYTVTSTAQSTGCSTSTTVAVTINALPTLVVTNPSAVCSPATVDLTVSSVTTGSDAGLTLTYWTDASVTTALTTPSAVATSGTYYIKAVNTSGCATIQPVAVTINALPTLVVTNPSAVCSPATVDLTASSVTTGSDAGLTLTYWTNASATTALTTPSAVGTSGTYYIKAVNTSGCATIQPVIVTINSASTNVTDIVSCNSYTWSVNGTTYTSSGTYTNVVGCHTEVLNLTINTVTTPTGVSNQTINGNVASDVTIEDIVVSGTGIIWYPTAADAANGTNAILAGTQLVDGTTYYAVSVNGSCVSSPLAVTVVVVLGKESFVLTSLAYYPNPVVDQLTITYNREITSIEIYDLKGQLIKVVKPRSQEVQVNMTELSTAMYIVRVYAEDKSAEIKIFKK
jgi:hypothetical protein